MKLNQETCHWVVEDSLINPPNSQLMFIDGKFKRKCRTLGGILSLDAMNIYTIAMEGYDILPAANKFSHLTFK